MLGAVADVLRLAGVPVLAYAAWHDYRSRRVPNTLWVPVLVVGMLALVIDLGAAVLSPGPLPGGLLATVGLSLLVVPLALLAWLMGLFGGADAKAIMALAILFPTAPAYSLGGVALPVADVLPGPFVATVIVNALLVAVLYLLHLGVRNLLAGRVAPQALYARPIPAQGVTDRFGIVLSPSNGSTAMEYLGVGGVDATVLQQYREWRGIGDGDTWTAAKRRRERGGDPWATQRFVAQADGPLYGTTPRALRETLDYLDREDRVWFSPAVPYIVPLFVGLVVSLTVGVLPALVL